MVDLSYYINNDWFKIGRFGEKHVKYINYGLLAIGGVFIISFFFYTIIYSSTHFSTLDELEDYTLNYDTVENSEFERNNLAMKIMPSYNAKNNALYMEHSNDIYKTTIPDSLSIMENFNMNNTFFFINQTALFFPTLSYRQENIPVGDSISMCLSVSWAPKEKGLNYDLMKRVKGFPMCKEALSGKFIWNTADPKFGIDVPVWKQNKFEIDCTDNEDCTKYCRSYNAEYVAGKNTKRCYSYETLETICFSIEYDNVTDEFKYAGGCFKDGSHYLMKQAVPNTDYKFDGIEIEVRNKKDPVIMAGEMSNFTYRFGQSWNFFVTFLNILIFFSIIGLIVIGYYIWIYKKKYNSTAALLTERKNPATTATHRDIESTMRDPNKKDNLEA